MIRDRANGSVDAVSGPISDEQAAVTELVPQISLVQRRLVRVIDPPHVDDRLEQIQVRRLGFVPPGDDAVDSASRAIRREHEIGPPASRGKRAVARGNRLQRSSHRCSDRDDAATRGARGVDHASGMRAH